MQKNTGRVLFSTGDLVDYLECAHAATLSFKGPVASLARAEDDDRLALVANRGFLERIKKGGFQVLEMPFDGAPVELGERTVAADD